MGVTFAEGTAETVVGVHWAPWGGPPACGSAGSATPAMGGVTCAACQAEVQRAVAELTPAPPEWFEELAPVSGELRVPLRLHDRPDQVAARAE